MRVAVTGSSGLIGRALVARLQARGDEVVRLRRGGDGPDTWDPASGSVAPGALEGVAAVVHLAGAPVAGRRWNAGYKSEILRSRVEGTSTVARAAAGAGVGVMVSASAVGWYGADRGDEPLEETSSGGDDFLGRVCREWEAATGPASEAGVRVANVRTGIVLSAAGGALSPQLPLFRVGLGARLGSGRQWTSWIGIEDEVGGILHVLDTDLAGPVNLTAPEPVTNAEFTRTLASVLHRPAFLAVPAAVIRLALGREMADETLLAGQRVLPSRLTSSGYRFAHPDLRGALGAVLG
ncbi:MAG TPA: TIGR01777 family oxidoreductase [Acidimicrobiales bacterium]|nr:TIGR01777 family oxidoreductase [Acidimicrobiales bacterium]